MVYVAVLEDGAHGGGLNLVVSGDERHVGLAGQTGAVAIGRREAESRRIVHDLHASELRHKPLREGPGAVRAPVVDDDELVVLRDALEGLEYGLDARFEIALLVPCRNHDGQAVQNGPSKGFVLEPASPAEAPRLSVYRTAAWIWRAPG